MGGKDYVLISITLGYGSVTHTSKDSVEECLKVGRRYIKNRRARPVAICYRKTGEIMFSQAGILEWAKENWI